MSVKHDSADNGTTRARPWRWRVDLEPESTERRRDASHATAWLVNLAFNVVSTMYAT